MTKSHSEFWVDKPNLLLEKVIAKIFSRLLNMFGNRGKCIIGFGGMDASGEMTCSEPRVPWRRSADRWRRDRSLIIIEIRFTTVLKNYSRMGRDRLIIKFWRKTIRQQTFQWWKTESRAEVQLWWWYDMEPKMLYI